MSTFLGYQRENGEVGVRNYIIVLPTVICANSVAVSIEREVPEVVAIPHTYGCTLDPRSNEEVDRVLSGVGLNPNVAGILLVSLGCESAEVETIYRTLADSGKIVDRINIQQSGGTFKAINKGITLVKRMLKKADDYRREEFPASALIVGTECGASDSYSGLTANPALGKAADRLVKEGGTVILSEVTEFIGAEKILAGRCLNEEIKARLLKLVKETEERLAEIGSSRVADITPGNIEGGLTTIEEKSLGNIKKGGSSKISEVVDYGQRPLKKGLVVMDTPGHDIESITGMTAGGAQLVVFTTGRGTPTGSPILPVIKVASNSRLYEHQYDNMDLDAGRVISGKVTLEEMGEEIYKKILSVASGERTRSEILKNREFAIRRIGTGCLIY